MGKPLISDAQMLAIHGTTLRLRSLERQANTPLQAHGPVHAAGPWRQAPIALLAATLLQLCPADLLFTQGQDLLAEEVLALAQEATFSPQRRASCMDAGENAASFAAGHAFAQARSTRPGDDAPVTVALLRSTPDFLGDTLRLAGEAVLPLLLLVQSGDVVRAEIIESVPNVEVIRIDANDAVACCRVMQESLLHTRNRWGSVVLQAVTLPGAADPVAALEAHLRRRKLSF